MTRDRSDAVVVRWDADPERRLVFEPARGGSWTRIEQVRERSSNPIAWRTVGSERVSDLGFENVPGERTGSRE